MSTRGFFFIRSKAVHMRLLFLSSSDPEKTDNPDLLEGDGRSMFRDKSGGPRLRFSLQGSSKALNVDIVIQHAPRKTRDETTCIPHAPGAYNINLIQHNSEADSNNGFCPARELQQSRLTPCRACKPGVCRAFGPSHPFLHNLTKPYDSPSVAGHISIDLSHIIERLSLNSNRLFVYIPFAA